MLNRFRPFVLAAAACVAAAASVTPAAAETAKEIFKTAMERYEKQLASIESITIVQEAMGVEMTTRLEKKMVDGRPALVASGMSTAGDHGEMYRHFDAMAENATVKGTENVDGHACWAVHVEDLENMGVAARGAKDFESTDGVMYLDKKDFMVRRIVMNGVATSDGEKKPLSMDMLLKDYREVDGWMHPFVTEVTLAGEDGKGSADIAKMKKQMAEMKKQLAEMPPEQREMVEKMMKERMPELEAAGETGRMVFKVTVKELRVNEPAE